MMYHTSDKATFKILNPEHARNSHPERKHAIEKVLCRLTTKTIFKYLF